MFTAHKPQVSTQQPHSPPQSSLPFPSSSPSPSPNTSHSSPPALAMPPTFVTAIPPYPPQSAADHPSVSGPALSAVVTPTSALVPRPSAALPPHQPRHAHRTWTALPGMRKARVAALARRNAALTRTLRRLQAEVSAVVARLERASGNGSGIHSGMALAQLPQGPM
jgi:hypothetical protein